MEGTGLIEDQIIAELPLDRESRKYIHVTINNIIKKYDQYDKMTKKVIKYPMELCSKEVMSTSEYRKKFYESRMKNSFFYCAQNSDIYMQGTRDWAIYKKDHAYVFIEVKRCSNKIRNELSDPKCASEAEIDAWTDSK